MIINRIFIPILLLLPLFSYGNERELSIEDCYMLFENGRGDETVASLLNILNDLEYTDEFNEDKLGSIFMLLSNVYSQYGDLRALQNLCGRVMQIFNLNSEVANTELSRTIWRIRGAVSIELKDYDDALQYLLQAQWAYEDESVYDQGYFGTLTHIGVCYYNKKDYATAKLYFDEAYDIHKKYWGNIEDSIIPDSYQLLNNQGMLCQQMGDVEMAEKYFLTIINSIQDDEVLARIKEVATMNLGTLYTIVGKYNEARRLFESVEFKNPYFSYLLLQNLAINSLFSRRYDLAQDFIEESNIFGLQFFQSVLLDFAEVERENLWAELSNQLANCNNILAFWTKQDTSLKRAFEYNSFTRDFSLSFQQLVKDLFLSQDIGNNAIIWDNYQNERALLSYGFKSIEEHDSIAIKVIRQEREILSNLNLDVISFIKDNYNVETISKNLNDDEVLIDCVYMNMPKGESIDDGFEAGTVAFILTNESSIPQMYPIFNQHELYTYIKNENWDAETINELYTESNDSLYKLIIRPIIPLIKGKKKIYLRTCDLLSLVNIGAIRMPGGQRFDDVYDLNIVSNFRMLMDDSFKHSYSYCVFSDIALVGDAKYGANIPLEDNINSFEIGPTKEFAAITGGDRGNWGDLPGTKIEIHLIDSIVSENGIKSYVFLDWNATESQVKFLSGCSPSIMHLATHGFFISDVESLRSNHFVQNTIGYSARTNLMLYSGLLFTGANLVWTGKSAPNPIDDGILTADEISRLDFSNTDLVVLSACDSGRGHFSGTDGIMGLQRAFKAAGVKTMVLSLWKVPDIPTSMLMGYFYQNLFSGQSVRLALKQAQQQIQKDGYRDPYYWASFIVID